MTDDSIRELHGCKCMSISSTAYESCVIVTEGDDLIVINLFGNTATLTRWQARYIASKLYRLARRIRDREGETS